MHRSRTTQRHAAAVPGLVAVALLATCGGERKQPAPSPPPPESAPAAPAVAPAQSDTDFVDVAQIAPGIELDIRYATASNFAGEAVYPVARCLLRRPVAVALAAVQRDLERRGLGLKVWDCYRPISVQQEFWRLVPDERYVARPVQRDGVWVDGSKHNRGAAVDLTLVGADGAELPMPTDYDDFTEKAHRDYAGGSDEARANAKLLEDAMVARGFAPLPTEWWHFDGPGWRGYELSNEPLE